MSPAFEDYRRLDKDAVSRLIKADVMGDKPSPALEPLFSDDPPPADGKKAIDPMPVIKTVAFVVSVVSALTSMWYTFSWYRASQPAFLSLILAAVIGSCQVLLPELAIFFFRKRRLSSILSGVLIAILALIATGFSMGATVGGLYDARSAKLSSVTRDKAAISSVASSLAAAEERKARALSAMAAFDSDAELYSGQVASLLLEGKAVYQMELRRDAARKGSAAEAKKIELADQEISALKKNDLASVVIRDDFYSWIAGRAKATPEGVEFLMTIFPAVFNEVVAPAMLAIVLFL